MGPAGGYGNAPSTRPRGSQGLRVLTTAATQDATRISARALSRARVCTHRARNRVVHLHSRPPCVTKFVSLSHLTSRASARKGHIVTRDRDSETITMRDQKPSTSSASAAPGWPAKAE